MLRVAPPLLLLACRRTGTTLLSFDADFNLGDVTNTSTFPYPDPDTGVSFTLPIKIRGAGAILLGLDTYVSGRYPNDGSGLTGEWWTVPHLGWQSARSFWIEAGAGMNVASIPDTTQVFPWVYVEARDKYFLSRTVALEWRLQIPYWIYDLHVDIDPFLLLDLGPWAFGLDSSFPLAIAKTGAGQGQTPNSSLTILTRRQLGPARLELDLTLGLNQTLFFEPGDII